MYIYVYVHLYSLLKTVGVCFCHFALASYGWPPSRSARSPHQPFLVHLKGETRWSAEQKKMEKHQEILSTVNGGRGKTWPKKSTSRCEFKTNCWGIAILHSWSRTHHEVQTQPQSAHALGWLASKLTWGIQSYQNSSGTNFVDSTEEHVLNMNNTGNFREAKKGNTRRN